MCSLKTFMDVVFFSKITYCVSFIKICGGMRPKNSDTTAHRATKFGPRVAGRGVLMNNWGKKFEIFKYIFYTFFK